MPRPLTGEREEEKKAEGKEQKEDGSSGGGANPILGEESEEGSLDTEHQLLRLTGRRST